jgi:hypothetical protein
MPGLYVDDKGALYEYDDETVARRAGLRPATTEDKVRHNEAIDHAAKVKAAEGDNFQTFREEASRIGSGVLELGANVPGVRSLFDAPSKELLPYEGATEALGDRSNITAGREFSDDAIIRREANPGAAWAAEALATAPLAAIPGGLAAGAATRLGAGAVGAAAATIGTESAVSGLATEYTDSWLENRPMELGNVVRNTAMAAVGDLFFRGAFHLGGKGIAKLRGTAEVSGGPGSSGAAGAPTIAPDEGGIMTGNTIGRAAAKARRQAKSAGAAAAGDVLGERFDHDVQDAIRTIKRGENDAAAGVLAKEADGLRTTTASNLANDVDEAIRIRDGHLSNNKKYEVWGQTDGELVDHELDAQQEWVESQVLDGATHLLEEIKDSRYYELTHGLGKKTEEILEYYQGVIREEADGTRRHVLLDRMKQALDGIVESAADSFSIDKDARESLIKMVRPYTDDVLREGLVNPDYWGRGAELQREINLIWPEVIEPSRYMERKITEFIGKNYGVIGPGRNIKQVKASALKSLLAEDPQLRTLSDKMIAASIDGADKLAETYQKYGVEAPELAQLRDTTVKIRKQWNANSLLQAGEARARQEPGLFNLATLEDAGGKPGMVAGVAKAAKKIYRKAFKAGDIPEFEADDAIGRVMREHAKIIGRNPDLADITTSGVISDHITKFLNKNGGKVASAGPLGLVGLFGATQDEDDKPADPTTLEGAYGKALKDIATTGENNTSKRAREFIKGESPKAKHGPLSLFTGKRSLSEALQDRRQLLEDLDPERLINGLERATGQLAQTHPSVYTAVTQQVLQIAAYLKRELPPVRGKTPLNPKGNESTLDDQIAFAMKFVGATSPEQTLTDIARGRALPQQVAALKENWRDLYETFRIDLRGQLELQGERGEILPTERMRQLDTLLDLDGVATPGLGWKVADTIEAARATQEQAKGQPPAASKAPDLSKHFQSLSQAQADLRMNA